MERIWRTAFVALSACVLFGVICFAQDDNLSAQLPNSLLECYQNSSLYYRGNRLPQHINVFIDLVRKIEDVPDLNMDMRELSLALLYRFRLDGVEYDPTVQSQEGVLPYSVKGKQMFKNQLILKNLVQGNANKFPNDSLSSIEKCSLHFMMSSSIDATKRGDEDQTCNQIHTSRYQNPRYKREAPQLTTLPIDIPPMVSDYEDDEDESINISEIPSTQSSTILLSKIEESISKLTTLPSTSTVSAQEKIKKPTETVDGDLTTEETSPSSQLPVDEEPVDSVRVLKAKSVKPAVNKGDNKQSDAETVAPFDSKQPASGKYVAPSMLGQDDGTSNCPLENGVVLTRWGTVNLGNLLAGIAAGLNPLNVRTSEISSRSAGPVYDGQIDNKYAVTFAGDLAEVALIQGSIKGINSRLEVGAFGGWNQTALPQWYFVLSNTASDITDAEIRGDLDGLILASKLQNWYDNVSNKRLKLSQLLDLYYNKNSGIFGSKDYKACNRKNLFSTVAPTEVLKPQTRAIASILNRRLPTPGTILEEKIFEFANNAVDSLIGYIPGSLDVNTNCESLEVLKRPKVNLTIAIDLNYGKDALQLILNILWQGNFQKYGSNLTVVNGYDGSVLVPATNLANITYNLLLLRDNLEYTTNKGMRISYVLNALRDSYKQHLEDMKRNGDILDRRSVLLFLPSETSTVDDSEYNKVYDIVQGWKENLPIVRVLFACKCSMDKFQHLVIDSQRDIIPLNTINNQYDTLPIVKRIEELTQPLINPRCGSTFPKMDPSQQIKENVDYLEIGYTRYYSIHPKYFYGIDTTIKIKVVGYAYGQFRACAWVDSSELISSVGNSSAPGNNTSQCQTISTVTNKEWSFSNPCSTASSVNDCTRSIYLAVTIDSSENKCLEDQCESVSSVKWGIVTTGLHCSGASPNVVASVLLLFAAFLFVKL